MLAKLKDETDEARLAIALAHQATAAAQRVCDTLAHRIASSNEGHALMRERDLARVKRVARALASVAMVLNELELD